MFFVFTLPNKAYRLFEYNYQYCPGSETTVVTGLAITLTDIAHELNNIAYVGCVVDIINIIIIVVLFRRGGVFFFF